MDIYEIIGKLLAAFVVGLLAYLAPKVKAWFEANASKATQDKVRTLVRSFARAAEQLLHDTDPDGSKRRKFVMDQLTAMGIEITEAVLNMIEAEVWVINTETKKAQVQDKEVNVNTTVAFDTGDGSVRTVFKGSTNGTTEAEAQI